MILAAKCHACGNDVEFDEALIGQNTQCQCGHTLVLSLPRPPAAPRKSETPRTLIIGGLILLIASLVLGKIVFAGLLAGLFGGLIIALVAGLYFLPTIIAVRRAHPNDLGVLLLNALLGWTLFGWVAALVWSVHRR